ncbi:MAG: hypothetical protein NTY38_11165, partial [Acidobacteria bacterium]|nr:hypothetical protein [Acidobacteriota bacterium]
AVLLAGLLALLVSMAATQRRDMADTRMAIERLERQLRQLSVDEARMQTTLRRPENTDVLERAIFLNGLLQRKGISWTKIFADLESVMPYDVRLISVRPAVTAQNEIVLDMLVGAQSSEPVLKLFIQLEGSPLFGQTSLYSSVPPSQTDPLFKYRVSVNYAQKL